MPAHALILFDIDGTLLITGGASSRAIRRAARAVLGERLEWGPVTVGTTDPLILLELARNCGIEGAEAELERYREVYLAELAGELERARAADQVNVMPGVRQLLAGHARG